MAKIITDSKSIVKNGETKSLVEIRCDALSDITPADPDWMVGSLAAVADEQSIFMLKSNGTWVDMIV